MKKKNSHGGNGTRRMESMRDAATLFASLGLSAVADAHGDGAMKRKKAFKAYVQHADGKAGRGESRSDVQVSPSTDENARSKTSSSQSTSSSVDDAKTALLRVNLADIEKSCGRIGCAWCVKDFIDDATTKKKKSNANDDGDAMVTHRRRQLVQLPLVEIELEDNNDEGDLSSAQPVVIVRAD